MGEADIKYPEEIRQDHTHKALMDLSTELLRQARDELIEQEQGKRREP